MTCEEFIELLDELRDDFFEYWETNSQETPDEWPPTLSDEVEWLQQFVAWLSLHREIDL